MNIYNDYLSENEREWLDYLFAREFLYRKEIIHQIEHANLYREYTDYFISLQFCPCPCTQRLKIYTRVPIEMRAFFKDSAPVQFLLHIINGFVQELEIFKADSTKISPDFKIQNSIHIEYIVADEIELSSL